MQTNTTAQPPPGAPITWAIVRDIVRRRFLDGSHWLAVFDEDTEILLDKITDKFYRSDGGADLDVVAVSFLGERFTIACMRKSRMPSRKYKKLLDRFGVRYGAWDPVSQDGALIVTQERMFAAIAMVQLLREPSNDLAMAA